MFYVNDSGYLPINVVILVPSTVILKNSGNEALVLNLNGGAPVGGKYISRIKFQTKCNCGLHAAELFGLAVPASESSTSVSWKEASVYVD